MRDILKNCLNLIILGMLVGCGPRGNKPNVELIQDMMDQKSVKAQKEDKFFPNGISSLVPPEKTIPRGSNKPYPFKTDPLAAKTKLVNPVSGDFSEPVIFVGRKYYEINCAVCHGYQGDGNGPIKEKYPPQIPSLLSEKVRGWKDAEIYHVIAAGQGVMGAYASHIPEQSRWQVVNYIRYLQKNRK